MNEKKVSYQGNTITIHRLNYYAVGQFYDCIRSLVGVQGCKAVFIKIAPNISLYPNQILPIVGVIEYYRSQGISVEFRTPNPMYSELVTPQGYSEDPRILGRVWKFTQSKDVSNIVDGYRREFEKVGLFANGTLYAMEWALNEVMDNVLRHSGVNCGYVMAQYHQENKRIALSVFDYGQGIMSSFSDSEYYKDIQNDVDAIKLALTESVTRDKSAGQGNGLFGLVSIVKEGHGLLNIRSGRGYYSIDSNGGYTSSSIKTKKREKYPNKEASSTLVDFQLNQDKEINLKEIDLFKDYDPVDLHLEDFEDDTDSYVYDIAMHSEGTGTREAGLRARNQILNLIAETRSCIILDFSNVGVISSSYADELIVKLLLHIGIIQFNKAITFKGLSNTHQSILERSFRQRTSQEQVVRQGQERTMATFWKKGIAYVKSCFKR